MGETRYIVASMPLIPRLLILIGLIQEVEPVCWLDLPSGIIVAYITILAIKHVELLT